MVDVSRVDDSHEQVGVGSREKRRRNLDQSEKGICFELNGVVGGRGIKLLSSRWSKSRESEKGWPWLEKSRAA